MSGHSMGLKGSAQHGPTYNVPYIHIGSLSDSVQLWDPMPTVLQDTECPSYIMSFGPNNC